jgi:hypothetical protein
MNNTQNKKLKFKHIIKKNTNSEDSKGIQKLYASTSITYTVVATLYTGKSTV